MKAVVQRVKEASVRVDGVPVGAVGHGLLVLLCAEPDDTDATAEFLAGKIARLRIFADDDGRFNLSLLDIGGAVLVVSQFTLVGDWRRGNRPSFSKAAAPDIAEPLYEAFCRDLAAFGVEVATGTFAAHMEVASVNDGPVTLWMDTAAP